MVVKDVEDRMMLVKKASIINQVVVPRSVRGTVMRHTHMHHRGVSATLKEIKRRCYWPNCALDMGPDDPEVFYLPGEAMHGPAQWGGIQQGHGARVGEGPHGLDQPFLSSL